MVYHSRISVQQKMIYYNHISNLYKKMTNIVKPTQLEFNERLSNKYNANILSAYSNKDANSRKGKKQWLSKNAKPTGTVHLVQRADKQKYATTNGKPNILIDDYIKNIKEWENAGGIGVHHTSPTDTISQLKRIGFR